MTLKGIPKDTNVYETWHDDAIYGGSDCCPCKRDKQLTKDNLETVLLEPVQERRVLENFKSFMTWSWTSTRLRTAGYQKLENLFKESAESAKQTESMNKPGQDEEYDGYYSYETIDLDISLVSLYEAEYPELENLNGATSYEAFCERLMVTHYRTGSFYQGLKQCLFSTRHKKKRNKYCSWSTAWNGPSWRPERV